MIFDRVPDSLMQAAQFFSGLTMAAFVAAPIFGGRARYIRIAVAGCYIAGVLGFLVYVLV